MDDIDDDSDGSDVWGSAWVRFRCLVQCMEREKGDF